MTKISVYTYVGGVVSERERERQRQRERTNNWYYATVKGRDSINIIETKYLWHIEGSSWVLSEALQLPSGNTIKQPADMEYMYFIIL